MKRLILALTLLLTLVSITSRATDLDDVRYEQNLIGQTFEGASPFLIQSAQDQVFEDYIKEKAVDAAEDKIQEMMNQ